MPSPLQGFGLQTVTRQDQPSAPSLVGGVVTSGAGGSGTYVSAGSSGTPSVGGVGAVAAPPMAPSTETAVLLVGDSMVRRGRFAVDSPRCLTLAARGGISWKQDRDWIKDQILTWRDMVLSNGQHLGEVLIWAGGNDLYPRSGVSRPSAPSGVARTVASLVGELADVIPQLTLIGPTPRPAYDEDSPWGKTPAFLLENQLIGLRGNGIRVISIGRQVCVWKNGKPRGYVVRAGRFFTGDKVHLSRDGYRRVASRFPRWLKVDE